MSYVLSTWHAKLTFRAGSGIRLKRDAACTAGVLLLSARSLSKLRNLLAVISFIQHSFSLRVFQNENVKIGCGLRAVTAPIHWTHSSIAECVW